MKLSIHADNNKIEYNLRNSSKEIDYLRKGLYALYWYDGSVDRDMVESMIRTLHMCNISDPEKIKEDVKETHALAEIPQSTFPQNYKSIPFSINDEANL